MVKRSLISLSDFSESNTVMKSAQVWSLYNHLWKDAWSLTHAVSFCDSQITSKSPKFSFELGWERRKSEKSPHQVSFSAFICGYVLPTCSGINRSLLSSKILAGFEIQCQRVICLLWHYLAKKILFRKRHLFLGPDSKTFLLTSTCPREIHWYSTNWWFQQLSMNSSSHT